VVDVTWLTLFKFAPLLFELCECESLSGSDSFRIENNNVLNFRTFAKHVFQFDVLLTIGDKENAGA
jgi:hypothetical protein